MNLGHLVHIVKESRDLTAMVFPLPDVAGCVDYAITEAGEYLDAIKREERTGDKRNNDKAHDKRHEWGQCGYMIASAVMQISDFPMKGWLGEKISVYSVMGYLCSYRTSPALYWLTSALCDWATVCETNGWKPADLLADTCTAFEQKHLPELFA